MKFQVNTSNMSISKRIAVMLLTFLIFLPFTYNYMLFSRFGVSETVKKNPFFDAGEELVISKDEISKNSFSDYSEPNGVGISCFNYKYTVTDTPKRIKSFSLKTELPYQAKKSISLNVSTSSSNYTVTSDEALIRENGEILWVINENDVNSLSVTASFDFYVDAENPDELFGVSNVSFNTHNQSKAINTRYIYVGLSALLVTLLIVFILSIVLFSNIDSVLCNRKPSKEKQFLITALAIGAVFAVLLPIYQIPDEGTHISIIYDELNWNFNYFDNIGDFPNTLQLIQNPQQKVDLGSYFNMSANLPIPHNFALPSVQILRHLPQALVLVVCTFLRVPAFISFTLCEFSALLFYVCICYLALKRMPIKKDMLAFIMLLPISIQQMGSFSYDAVTNPIAFLLFAEIMYLKFEKEYIYWKDIFIILGLTLVLCIVKPPYALTVILFVTVPVRKYKLKIGSLIIDGDCIKQNKWWFIAGITLIFALGVFVCVKFLQNNEYVKIVIAGVTDIKGVVRILYKSLSNFFVLYCKELVGSFGWHRTKVPSIVVVMLLSVMVLTTFTDCCERSSKGSVCRFSVWNKILIFVVGLGICALVELALITWTLEVSGVEDIASLTVNQYREYMHTLPYIGGVQGRYFLPVLPILLVPFSFGKLTECFKKINVNFALDTVYSISFVYIIVTLLREYWI